MSYNKQYNTRHSAAGRTGYNTPGQFVSAGEQQPAMVNQYQTPPQQQRKAPQQNNVNQQNLQTIQTMDVEMKPSMESLPTNTTNSGESTPRPHWMKSKLQGVKKLSNKERRRRQNENLRRLLTPKNALMVLNEMLPNEQLTNQFKVEPAAQNAFHNQYYNQKQQHSFCADLTINGKAYKGYGENKLTARNVAAEQAIRDLIIQKMNKVLGSEGNGTMDINQLASASGEDGDEDPLPMIQLASFALHKLFSEWEYEGHKVPQLKPSTASISEGGSEAGAANNAGGGGKPRPPAGPKKKELPANASAMHPCMLLTYMRPHLEYRELAVDGDKPQNITFTLGVDVDGSTYIGKGMVVTSCTIGSTYIGKGMIVTIDTITRLRCTRACC
ncbi:double-stranded RNA-specific editase 1-like [Phthorimaea operculella]|nr:double-stranded RNA-specific editase 1-like [Phthorimaea operculella]